MWTTRESANIDGAFVIGEDKRPIALVFPGDGMTALQMAKLLAATPAVAGMVDDLTGHLKALSTALSNSPERQTAATMDALRKAVVLLHAMEASGHGNG